MLLLPVAFAGDIDWAASTAETVDVLSRTRQAPSVNPPGNETVAALVLAEVLDEAGIPWEIWESAPGRGNLVARLEGGDEPPLCLLSHLDVVPFERESWPHDPLSGKVEDGKVWGRGALDMKSTAVVEVMTLVNLKRQGAELDRDIVLLAVADEEVDNAGVHTVMERWDEIGCSHVLNEGGIGVQDILFEGLHLWPVSVGEKGVLWVRMTAHGEPGHGSTPRPNEAPEQLLEALEPLLAWDPELAWHPAMIELFHNVGETRGGIEKFILTHPAVLRVALKKTVKSNALTHAALIDTIHVTGLEGANKPNVVPGTASALLDCRLQPGTSPDALLATIEALIDDETITLEVLSAQAAGVSEWHGDPLFDALSASISEFDEHATVAPTLSPGFTDSIYLREMGVVAYGMMPFLVTEEELATMHGNGEHIRVEELERGLKVLYATIERYAGPQ